MQGVIPLKGWPLALNQFEILCGIFEYDLLKSKKRTYTKFMIDSW